MAKDNWADFMNPLQIAAFTMFAWQKCRKALDPMATTQRISFQ